MKTTAHHREAPLDGNDRLMDALLHEHARAGSGADDAFLARLDLALDAKTAGAADSVRKRPSRRLAWSLGLAAGIALAAGLMWQLPRSGDDRSMVASEQLDQGGVPLVATLPPELIEGTPKPIKVPNLKPPPTKAPELMVPAATRLLSNGKTVTSSDDAPIIGSLDLITDGDKDAGEGYFVELWEGLQWIQIDLEQSAEIHAIWLWHFHSQKRAYHDVIIQISDDPGFKQGVTTIFNNDYDASAKMGKGGDQPYVETRFGLLIDGKGTKGRHVRLYSAGNTSNEMNHYIEVEVFGVAG